MAISATVILGRSRHSGVRGTSSTNGSRSCRSLPSTAATVDGLNPHASDRLRTPNATCRRPVFCAAAREAGAISVVDNTFLSPALQNPLALGADWCNSARGFMFALGCLQAQACHTGHCPTGVTTQDPLRQKSLVVPVKADRVYNFHQQTLFGRPLAG